MKILHLCLASHYTEGMTYQDNQLAEQNASDGHDVVVVSDCYTFKDGSLIKVREEDRVLSNGIRLVRMEYDFFFNAVLSSKIRKISRLYKFICSVNPDVILFHGVAGWEMLSAARYKKNNPEIKLYIDSHEDFHNSGTFWFSRFFQYRLFNRYLVNRVRSQVDKFLYLSAEIKLFLEKMYSLQIEEMEFYPIGGKIIDLGERKENKKKVLGKYGFSEEDILIVHSGKLDAEKRSVELLNAFYSVKNPRLKLIIIGLIPDDRKKLLLPLINRDDRVFFAGWKKSDALVQYLSAADLYFQPGTQSATMQNAICCGTPVAVYPYSSYKAYINGNGYYVKNEKDYKDLFEQILNKPDSLTAMSQKAYDLAYSMLDYKVLAKRLYH